MSQTLTVPQKVTVSPKGTAPRPPAVRLTFRGRLAVVLLLALLGSAVFSLGQVATHALAADPSAPVTSVPTTAWVVQPGQTLWQIAQTVAPDTDPRDTVARLVQLNDLPTSSVVAGQTLEIPA